MTKDILVDNCIAKNFCNPASQEYKDFIKWLRDEGTLVVTNRLIADYNRATAQSGSPSNICYLVALLQSKGRLLAYSKTQLATLEFPKRVTKRLRSNKDDWDQVKAVVLSPRKYAITLDANFAKDVNSFPGVTARAELRPSKIPYR